MQRYNGQLINQFANVINGNAAAGALVTVKLKSTGATVTLYAEDNLSGATLANPLTADAKGYYGFYAPDGVYTLDVSISGTPQLEIQLQDVAALQAQFDAALANAGYIPVGTFAAGCTVSQSNGVVSDGSSFWRWDGALPKTVTAGSEPTPTGAGNWILISGDGLRGDLAASDSAVLIAGVPAADVAEKYGFTEFSYSDDLRTITINPNYNTTNPQCKASINTAGTSEYPNRLGHSIAFGRDEAPLLTTYTVPVTFDVSSGAPYRNVFFLSKKNGFLQTFTPAELIVGGYGTSTISITPDAAKLSGSEEVTYWVVGNSDQFNDNATQNNLQNNIGGYDNITNRQMSYNLGAHNLIDGTGDHNGIYGATYSVIYSSGSYNAILGGQNNQHGGISGYSFLGGEGNRNFGSYNFMSGAFSVNNAASKFNFSFGRTLDTKSSENSACFGRDNVLNATSSLMWGQNHFNYTNPYSSVGGYGANCRNAGAQTFASSPDTVGANQKTEILSKRLTIASGGAWQKFNKMDDSPNLRLRASATALLTADVVVNLTGLNGLSQPINHAAIRCTALYNASLGIISSSFTVLHGTGTGGNAEVKFTQSPLGTDYVALEIRDAVTNNSGSAIADISIVEFLRV